MRIKFLKTSILLGVIIMLIISIVQILLGYEIGVLTASYNTLVAFGISIISISISSISQVEDKNDKNLFYNEFLEDQVIILEGPAKYLKAENSITGKLFLAKEQIIFIVNNYSQTNNMTRISLDSIKNITLAKNWKIVDSGLIIASEGTIHTFSIEYANDWKDIILNHMGENEINFNSINMYSSID